MLDKLFYLYIFLISLPIFINISTEGVRYASSVIKIPSGITINAGLLLVPCFAAALLFRATRTGRLKTGALGGVILCYLVSALAVALVGHLREPNAVRWFLLGQWSIPFAAYYYLTNFRERINIRVVASLLALSLFAQVAFLAYQNIQIFADGDTMDVAVFFTLFGERFYLYGIQDYYPILFLTLVIVFHTDTVMKIVPPAVRNAFIVATVLLYLFSVTFHSRNAILALGALFLFYLVRAWRDKMFFVFLSCLLFMILAVIAADANPLGRLSSVTRLADTVKEVTDLFNGGDAGTARKGGSTYLRFVTMMEAGRIFLERPLSGIAFAWPLAAHNQYLSMLAIGGIVPFTFFSYLLLLLHRMVRSDIGDNRSRANDHRQSRGMYGILIVFVVSSFFQNNFTVTYTSCLFWSLVGVYEIDRNQGADMRTGGTIPWGRPGNGASGPATTEER